MSSPELPPPEPIPRTIAVSVDDSFRVGGATRSALNLQNGTYFLQDVQRVGGARDAVGLLDQQVNPPAAPAGFGEDILLPEPTEAAAIEIVEEEHPEQVAEEARLSLAPPLPPPPVPLPAPSVAFESRFPSGNRSPRSKRRLTHLAGPLVKAATTSEQPDHSV